MLLTAEQTEGEKPPGKFLKWFHFILGLEPHFFGHRKTQKNSTKKDEKEKGRNRDIETQPQWRVEELGRDEARKRKFLKWLDEGAGVRGWKIYGKAILWAETKQTDRLRVSL